jgi:serine/threonine protein kinase
MPSGTVPTRRTPFISPERWEKIKGIFDAALQLPEQARPEFLHSVCCGDGELEAELQHLIATYEKTATSLELSAGAALSYAQHDESSRVLRNGQLLAGRFGVIRFIDSGGMGEVYEAWDAELQDLVALKTIRQEIAAIPTIIDRFKQEVKRARGISHPNVCRVYDLFSHELGGGERLWFLTMELLAGPTLSDRLHKQGPIAAHEALDLVEQIVAGLAAAHDLGVVHRDFKTSNVMLVPAMGNRTRAVITDFGLSVALSPGEYDGKQMARGGTPAYMAPEQASGGKVGLAADQYALGIVMCEMLTGERPKRSIEVEKGKELQLPSKGITTPWEAAIRRCLETTPDSRFKNVRDVLAALRPAQSRHRQHWAVAIVAVAVILIAAASISSQKQVRLEKLAELTPDTDFSTTPSISRDGKAIAYSSDRAETGNLDIWLQTLPRGTPVRITTDPAEDKYPSISPDGSSIAFRSERNGGGIYLADSAGKTQRLIIAGGRNPQFSPDGRSILYWIGDEDDSSASGKVYEFARVNGESRQIAAQFSDARWPVWSSDGRDILFTGCRIASEVMPACLDWWVVSRDGTQVQNSGALTLLRQQGIKPLEELGGWFGDTVLFTAIHGGATSIWGLRLSPKTLKAQGTSYQVTSGISRDVDPSLAADGTLVYSHQAGALHVWKITDALDVTAARSEKITQDPGTDSNPNVSRDGRWLVFSRLSGGRRDLWMRDMMLGTETALALPGSDKVSPLVDSAGKLIAFEARDPAPAIYLSDGHVARKLCDGCSRPTGWFDQNRGIFYRGGSAIKLLATDSGETETVLERVGMFLGEANWSSDNEYLLFTASTGNDNKQVFAVRFPKTTGEPAGNWIPITEASTYSDRPRWSGDGNAIFYLSRRDGFSCIWGQRFDAKAGKPAGAPFAVMHYHNLRMSPARIGPGAFDLSVSGNNVYLNVGEESASLWTGLLMPTRTLSWPF